EPYRLAAAPTLAGGHASGRERLDPILIEWPVAQQRGDAAGAHLRRLPLEIARRLRLDQLAPRDLLALTDVHVPAARCNQRVEPGAPVGVGLGGCRLCRRHATTSANFDAGAE